MEKEVFFLFFVNKIVYSRARRRIERIELDNKRIQIGYVHPTRSCGVKKENEDSYWKRVCWKRCRAQWIVEALRKVFLN